ncbi:DUF2634 domain-containing protein [Cohnella caldifontis]|uniref:DUF2634 domain-containing protein n=1 Tax=Cohnella caldifontis TaxID=3027471 RepID=UPI0023EC253A|nr:DUF2634 domain-containing protein [Cohnella sp. YIM B05605]
MADLFPRTAAAADPEAGTSENDASVAFGRSWLFDFDAGEFVLTPTGKIAVAEETDAWLEWCRKALQTERYRYLIYSRDYGQEYEGLIGGGLSRPAVESEIRRITVETLMTDPRTASVDGFVFAWDGERCSFTCTITNVRDESGTITGSVVNG